MASCSCSIRILIDSTSALSIYRFKKKKIQSATPAREYAGYGADMVQGFFVKDRERSKKKKRTKEEEIEQEGRPSG